MISAVQAQERAPLARGARNALPTRRAAMAFIVLCIAILAASFVKSDLTRNDFERFDDLRLLCVFFALFVGWCAAYVAVYRLRLVAAPGTLALVTVACTGLLLATFPVGSKDVFGYAFYGKLWQVYGANPYLVTPADFPGDAWQPYLQVRWRNLPTAYGPLFLWQAWLVSALAGTHLWAAVWLHKLCAALAWLAVVWVGDRVLHRTTASVAHRSWLLLLFAWNPLFLFEAAAGGHNDIMMVLLILGALWSWQTRHWHATLGLLALSFWYKWYSIIFVPIFLIETLKSSGWKVAVRQLAVCAGAIVGCGVVLLAPLPGSFSSIAGQLLHPGAMRGLYPNELSPPLAALYWALQAGGLFDTATGIHVFDASRFGLFGIAVMSILFRQWRAAPSFAALAEACCLVAAAFTLLLITMLLPWHVLVVIALGIISGREPFLAGSVVLTILALLSYFLTFAVATVLVAAVVTALWLMRRLGSRISPATS